MRVRGGCGPLKYRFKKHKKILKSKSLNMVFYACFCNCWNRIKVCLQIPALNSHTTTVTNHIAFQQWVTSSTQEWKVVWNEILLWIHNNLFAAFNMLLGDTSCLAYFSLQYYSKRKAELFSKDLFYKYRGIALKIQLACKILEYLYIIHLASA